MNGKLERLERTILELGSEVFRAKHRMDELEKDNGHFKQIFASLKKLMDEKGLITAEDFEEAVQLDILLKTQNTNGATDLIATLHDDLKKVVN